MPKATSKPLAMVAIEFPPGFTEITFPIIKALIDDVRAAHTAYLPPKTWLLCFKPAAAARAEGVVARVRELRARDARFGAIGAAARTGEVVYETDFWGRVRSEPMGDEANAVLRAAAADAGDG